MPNIRIRHLSPAPDFPGPWSGRAPGQRIPLRHLEAWVQDARRRILAGAVTDEDKARAMREADSAEVGGGEAMTITYTDELTALEQAQQDLADATADLLTLQREAFDENGQLKGGDAVPAEIRALLRKIAFARYVKPETGSGIEGTQGPAAGPATPNAPTPPAPAPSDEHRRGLFRTVSSVGGWKLPEDAATALKYAQQHGMPDLTAADVERWEDLPIGSLGA